MTLPRRPKRLPADNPLLRAAFARHWDMHPSLLRGHLSPGVLADYAHWLRTRGIDPDTGKMTAAGIAFFKSLLDEDRSAKSRRRAA